jgi:hypothetical protein
MTPCMTTFPCVQTLTGFDSITPDFLGMPPIRLLIIIGRGFDLLFSMHTIHFYLLVRSLRPSPHCYR